MRLMWHRSPTLPQTWFCTSVPLLRFTIRLHDLGYAVAARGLGQDGRWCTVAPTAQVHTFESASTQARRWASRLVSGEGVPPCQADNPYGKMVGKARDGVPEFNSTEIGVNMADADESPRDWEYSGKHAIPDEEADRREGDRDPGRAAGHRNARGFWKQQRDKGNENASYDRREGRYKKKP